MEHVSIHSTKKMLTSLLLIVGLLSVWGCFMASGYTKLSKPGATIQQSSQDLYECKRASQSSSMTGMASGGSGFITGGSDADPALWRACLKGRGYQLAWRSWSDHVNEHDALVAERKAIEEDTSLRQNIPVWNKRVALWNQRMDDWKLWESDN